MKIQAFSKVLHANALVGSIAKKETGPEFIMIPICNPAVLEINVFTLTFLGHVGVGGYGLHFLYNLPEMHNVLSCLCAWIYLLHIMLSMPRTLLTKFRLCSINTRKLMRSQRGSMWVSEASRMIPSWSIIWMWRRCSQIVNTRRTMRTPKPATIPQGTWLASLLQSRPKMSSPTSTTNSPYIITRTYPMPWVSSIPGMWIKFRVMWVYIT